MGAYEMKTMRDGSFMWNLKAGNGEVILTSQKYKSKTSAKKGIASTMKNSAVDARFERKVARNKKPFFVLKALNGQIIGKSELYESTRARDNGIKSVGKNGPASKIKDNT
ncbi:MAG: hypothetical protein ACI8Y4_005544 [Candidatus Poriferisodalaceae bacterium]|jgi:uncharacterized protein YegP (UPF0339 family)